MKDINECHNQTFLSRSNIYVCDNNGRDLYLLGVNVLVSQACKRGYRSVLKRAVAARTQYRPDPVTPAPSIFLFALKVLVLHFLFLSFSCFGCSVCNDKINEFRPNIATFIPFVFINKTHKLTSFNNILKENMYFCTNMAGLN